MNDLIAELLAHDRVRAARHHFGRTDEVTLARQAALSAVPAPTGAEGQRAVRVAELFRELGLRDVGLDEVGNVVGWAGGGAADVGAQHAAPLPAPVVLAAHLDTVFGPDVNVAVERRGPRLEGPGISDNARGLAALLAVAEAIVTTRLPTARPILFAATVGEEGSGDLRGVKHLLNGKREGGNGKPAGFIALDGAGLERVVHRALGAPPAPRTTCAIVRLGGGTALNSIPQEAWIDLDLRSEDPKALAQLDVTVRAALERALDDENRRRTPATPLLGLDVRLVGDRPSGITPRTHPLVQVAVAANRALGRDAELAAASTDANVPIALGIPAIPLGAGGKAGDAHLTTEWYENTDGALGIVRALLVTLATAEVQ